MRVDEDGLLETEIGTISGQRVQYVMENIFWREGDRVGMAATGALSAALGHSGVAAGMAVMSSEEMEEPVARVEFLLGEVPVEGLLWNWPFSDGDFVRVVGTRNGEGKFFALSVLDESKRLIVSYPHVSAGSWAHWISVVKYSLMFAVPYWAVFLGILYVVTSLSVEILLYAYFAGVAFLSWLVAGLGADSLAMRRWRIRYSLRLVGIERRQLTCGR